MIALGLLAAAFAVEPPPADAQPPRILYQTPLQYPDLARELPLPPVHCALSLRIDATGRLVSIVVPNCPLPFADEARRTLQDWRFGPATSGGQPVASHLDLSVRWQLDPNVAVPPPDPAQWQWTDRALAHLAQQDLVLGMSSSGIAVAGAAVVGLAVWGQELHTYRARYVAAGIGLALAVTFGIHAVVRLGDSRVRARQRALWADFRPAPSP